MNKVWNSMCELHILFFFICLQKNIKFLTISQIKHQKRDRDYAILNIQIRFVPRVKGENYV